MSTELKAAKKKAKQIINGTQSTACNLVKNSRNYIQKKPVPAILTIAIIGTVIGFIISVGKRKSKPFEEKREWLEEVLTSMNKKRSHDGRQWPYFKSSDNSLSKRARDIGNKLKFW